MKYKYKFMINSLPYKYLAKKSKWNYLKLEIVLMTKTFTIETLLKFVLYISETFSNKPDFQC